MTKTANLDSLTDTGVSYIRKVKKEVRLWTTVSYMTSLNAKRRSEKLTLTKVLKCQKRWMLRRVLLNESGLYL